MRYTTKLGLRLFEALYQKIDQTVPSSKRILDCVHEQMVSGKHYAAVPRVVTRVGSKCGDRALAQPSPCKARIPPM